MPTYSLTEPAVLVFVVIPLVLAALLLWGVSSAARRRGESAQARRNVLLLTGIGAGAWMALTWVVAASGLLRRWDATPPPFFLLVVGIVALAAAITFTSFG